LFVVPRFILLSILFLLSLPLLEDARSQTPGGADSAGRYGISADSLRVLDSAYRARKAVLDQWIHEQRRAAPPQEDFLSLYGEYGGYLQILPRDINQLFSERTLRPDPTTDRNTYGTVDRAIILGGAAQLSQTWGIFAEYDYTAKFLNTLVDSMSPGPQSLSGIEEALDLNEHAFVVGGMFVLYSSRFYRLRASGGIGAVIALTSETEAGGAARSASARAAAHSAAAPWLSATSIAGLSSSRSCSSSTPSSSPRSRRALCPGRG